METPLARRTLSDEVASVITKNLRFYKVSARADISAIITSHFCDYHPCALRVVSLVFPALNCIQSRLRGTYLFACLLRLVFQPFATLIEKHANKSDSLRSFSEPRDSVHTELSPSNRRSGRYPSHFKPTYSAEPPELNALASVESRRMQR